MSSNRPIRRKENLFSEILLKSAAKKDSYYLLTEDENISKLYKTIINKVAPEKNIDKVYGLGGKKEVLKYFREWKDKEVKVNNCFFIVDKDFDHWRGIHQIEEHQNILELPCYTIENIFYTPETAAIILETYMHKKGEELEEKYLSLEYWTRWEEGFAEALSNLFIYFAIVVKNKLEIPNCGEEPMRYIHYSHNDKILTVKEQEVLNYKDILVTQIGDINFKYEETLIREYYEKNDKLDYFKLIKGKYLLFGLLSKIRIVLGTKDIYHKEIDNALLNLLAHELPISYFKCFKKIKLI